MNFGKSLRSARYCAGLAACAILILVLGAIAFADDGDKAAAIVEKAAKRSTLDQEGTHPFHLKAIFAPTLEREKGSGRSGEIEIWWQSPTVYRLELRTPEFHRVEIINGSNRWQKNEGDYLPYWLQQIAVALIRPIPDLPRVLQEVRDSDIRHTTGGTDAKHVPPRMHCQWSVMSTNGQTQSGISAAVAIDDETGLIFYAGESGWGGGYDNYKDFHGRAVARKVTAGSPEVTANITTLEDLKNSPELFDTSAPDGDPKPFRFVQLDELTARKNLISGAPISWPTVETRPFEGGIAVEVVVDRNGHVREVPAVASENRALTETARNAAAAMQFKPFVIDGVPAEAFVRLTLSYKVSLPTGSEKFESAGTYFDRGRKASTLSAAGKSPYILRALFTAILADHSKGEGQYEDTWKSEQQWRREAKVGKSRFVRARDGDKWYRLEEGPDARLLALVLQFIEPIPTLDTYTESDWRIRRDNVGDTPAIRVISGVEGQDGKPEAQHSRAFWFDDKGVLLKTFTGMFDLRGLDFFEHEGVRMPRQILVSINGQNAMLIRLTDVQPADNIPDSTFKLKGHEWRRQFTAEER